MSAEQETPLKAIQVKLVLLGKLTQHQRMPYVQEANYPGEAAVGKSSLVLRFVSNDFNENNSPTIGAAFLTQSQSIAALAGGDTLSDLLQNADLKTR